MAGIQILTLVFLLAAAYVENIQVAQICEEKEKIKLGKSLFMECVDKSWVPRGKAIETKEKSRKKNPGAPPCEDSVSADQCQADRGHCNQFTEAGQEMDRVCPGTCESCDGCRCQDSSQWHQYCPYWSQYCDDSGVLGTWMTTNCRKSCNKCKCNCCSYKGKSHKLGERILLPDKCGELVCEEGLRAEDSPLLPGAVHHNVSHPEEVTLVFRSLHQGGDCCMLDNNTMVAEGWAGELVHNGSSFQGMCCHGVLSMPIKDINLRKLRDSTTTIATTTTTTTTTTITTPPGSKLYYEEDGAKFYGIPVAEGTTLREGVVADTCEAVGMRAVCNAASGCNYHSARCQVVDFEASCGNAMLGLAKKLCGGSTNPRNCPEINGLFNDMKGWLGECGVVDGSWCVQGRSHTSGNPSVYYAYCVKGYTKDKRSYKQKNGMVKEAAANFDLATDRQTDGEAKS